MKIKQSATEGGSRAREDWRLEMVHVPVKPHRVLMCSIFPKVVPGTDRMRLRKLVCPPDVIRCTKKDIQGCLPSKRLQSPDGLTAPTTLSRLFDPPTAFHLNSVEGSWIM